MKQILKIGLSSLLLSSLALAGGDKNVAEVKTIEIPCETPFNHFYIGLGLSGINFADDNTEETLQSLGATLKVGYQYNEYIALEARYSQSVGDVAYDKGTILVGTNISNYPTDSQNIALHIRPSYSLGDFTLYGLLGYGMLTYTDLPTGTSDKTESGFQWGIGLEYLITDNISIFIDYTALYNGTGFDGHIPTSDARSSMGTVGLAYHF